MSASSPTQVPPPGAARPLVLDEQTTFQSFLRKYALAGLLLVAAVAVGVILGRVLQSLRAQRHAAAWELFQTITQDPATSFSPENVSGSLAQAKERDEVYPWVVLSAVRHAFSSGDPAVLEALEPEIAAVEQSGALGGLYLQVEGQRVELAAYVHQQLQREASAALPAFTDPEPTGRRIRISISYAVEDTYDIVFGLYEDVAPVSSQRLVDVAQSGALVGKDVTPAFNALRVTGLGQGAETPEPLPLEARWGYFRTAGTLVTQLKPGAAGQQDGDVFQMLLQDDHNQEGQTTVFGKLVDGQAAWDALKALLPGPEDRAKVPPKLQIAAIDVLP